MPNPEAPPGGRTARYLSVMEPAIGDGPPVVWRAHRRTLLAVKAVFRMNTKRHRLKTEKPMARPWSPPLYAQYQSTKVNIV